jgi:hypothetical protein
VPCVPLSALECTLESLSSLEYPSTLRTPVSPVVLGLRFPALSAVEYPACPAHAFVRVCALECPRAQLCTTLNVFVCCSTSQTLPCAQWGGNGAAAFMSGGALLLDDTAIINSDKTTVRTYPCCAMQSHWTLLRRANTGARRWGSKSVRSSPPYSVWMLAAR